MLRIQSGCKNTLLGKDDEFIIKLKDSSDSNMLSIIIETLNVALVSIAGIVTLNGPE